MIDRYFIKSFINTCLFIGALLVSIIWLCFYSVWAAWFFLLALFLFFGWYYRPQIEAFGGRFAGKFIGFISSVLSLPATAKKYLIVFLEKLRLALQ
ncbi:MAG: hypothetical protein HZB54_01150 [Deltaproteobacteria bacterium]|nr:hypothetical protein [Deltaproteobacteria bacterium]